MSDKPLVKRSGNVYVLGQNISVIDETLRKYNLTITSPGIVTLLPGARLTGTNEGSVWCVIGDFSDKSLISDMHFFYGEPRTTAQALLMENVETAIDPRKLRGDIP